MHPKRGTKNQADGPAFHILAVTIRSLWGGDPTLKEIESF